MSAKEKTGLDGVAETLLIPLYIRALDARRPDSLLRDGKAAEIVQRMNLDLTRFKLQGHDEAALVLRVQKFDQHVLNFLQEHANGVVVHIGCGLDTRFERVDNGGVEWYDLDLPEVMELREKYCQSVGERYHALSASAFDDAWMKELDGLRGRPFLFLAEGVFPYFPEAMLKALFLKLRDHFPGAFIAFDAHTPYVVFVDNFQLALTGVRARLHWGLKHSRAVEEWGAGLRLVEEWYYFDHPEPLLQAYRWMGRIPGMAKSAGIFLYQLGQR